MYKLKIFIASLLIISGQISCIANSTSYYNNSGQYYDNSYNSGYYPYNSSYCTPPDEGILSKIKKAFLGTPTGFTPQIGMPSQYLNQYGPAYMQNHYGYNGWNSHNVYSPFANSARVRILD